MEKDNIEKRAEYYQKVLKEKIKTLRCSVKQINEDIRVFCHVRSSLMGEDRERALKACEELAKRNCL